MIPLGGLQRNATGQLYKPGVGDDVVWAKIYDVAQTNPLMSQLEIAKQVGCSQGLVSKVLHR